MKKFEKLKKTICFLLAVSMLLSLTACGKKAEAQGQNLYVLAKGIGTAKLTVKISGKFPEGTSPVISYFSQDKEGNNADEIPVISVNEKSLKTNIAEYIVTGLSSGHDELKISFIKDEISYSRITAAVTVDENLKISECQLNLNESPDKYVFEGGIVTEIIDDYLLDFTIPDENFSWKIKSYDEDVITVSGPYYDEEEGTTSFRIFGKEEGETHVILVNEDDGKKVDLAVESYITDFDESDNEIFVRVISSEEEEYSGSKTVDDVRELNRDITVNEYTDEEGRTVIERKYDDGTTVREYDYDDNITVKEYIDEDGNKAIDYTDKNGNTVREYTDKDGEVVDEYPGNREILEKEYDEAGSSTNHIENLYIPGNYEICDVSLFEGTDSGSVIQMEMQTDKKEFFINAWGNRSLAAVRDEVTDEEVRKTCQNITVAGIAAEYYNVSGVDLFLFEKENVIYAVAFSKESDPSAHKAVVENISWVK